MLTGNMINHISLIINRSYFSTGFGMAILDLESRVFPATVNALPVYHTAVFNNNTFIATDEGVYQFTNNSGNQSDLNNWELLDDEIDQFTTYSSRAVAVYNNAIYFDVNDDLYRYDLNTAELVENIASGFTTKYLHAGPDHLFWGQQCNQNGGTDNCVGKVSYIDRANDVRPSGSRCRDRANGVYETPSGVVYYADRFNFYRMANAAGGNCSEIRTNSPRTFKIHDIALIDSALWVSAGGADDNFTYLTATEGSYFIRDGIWNFIDYSNFPVLQNNDIRDHYTIKKHPDGRIVISTVWSGLITLNENEVEIFDQENSILEGGIGDLSRERVLGLEITEEGDIWMTNYLATRPLKVFRADGQSEGFRLGQSTLLHTMVRDDFDNLWIADNATTNGLVVFNILTEEFRRIGQSDEGLPSNKVLSLTKDRDGAIWVGTDQGIAVFNCGEDPINSDFCNGTRPRITQDGFLAFLLRDQFSNTIAVDAANRKWVGTQNGVFVVSPDGTEEITQFTADNSPLPDDGIIDIEIDQSSGRIYIATENGIVFIRGEAVEGGQFHSAQAEVFPNPVQPQYDGPIAIRGLAEDSSVKIADTQGRLVFETRSLGGQAVWDGRDFEGRRVRSGIYYVLASTTSAFGSSDGIVAEIAIIR